MKKYIMSALAAVILAALSFFIKGGSDAGQIETVGLITRWGFPVRFASTSPGWSSTRFDGVHFWMNVIVCWGLILMAGYFFRKQQSKK